MDSYTKLLDGYHKFRQKYLQDTVWRQRAKDKQSPEIMIIACSDSRVNPVILTGAGLGEIFVVNNIANLVPPYKKYGNSYHGTSAAIEYAVIQLRVRHIIIMGHSGCGGIRALLAEDKEPEPRVDAHYSFIRPWMKIVDDAADFTASEKSVLSMDVLAAVCERRASMISLHNLKGFPWVEDAMRQNSLHVHAWHFDIASGILEEYDEAAGQFQKLI